MILLWCKSNFNQAIERVIFLNKLSWKNRKKHAVRNFSFWQNNRGLFSSWTPDRSQVSGSRETYLSSVLTDSQGVIREFVASSLTTYGNIPRELTRQLAQTTQKVAELGRSWWRGRGTLAEATYATVCLFKLSLSKAPELPRNERRRKLGEKDRHRVWEREKRRRKRDSSTTNAYRNKSNFRFANNHHNLRLACSIMQSRTHLVCQNTPIR